MVTVIPISPSPSAGDDKREGSDLGAAGEVDSQIEVHLGRGDGTFDQPRGFVIGGSGWWLLTGDFTGKGHVDLATGSFSHQGLVILEGVGAGEFRRKPLMVAGDRPRAAIGGSTLPTGSSS